MDRWDEQMADETTELRGQIAKGIVDVIDAVSTSQRRNRMDLVGEILREWASQRLSEAVSVCRVAGVNPSAAETTRNQSGR